MDATADPALRQLLDSARISDAIRSRSGFGALCDHLADDASLAGLLANLSDLAYSVALTLTSHRERIGRIELVGTSGLVLRSSTGTRSLLQMNAIASLRTSERCQLSGDGRIDTSCSWSTMVASFIESSDDITVSVGGQNCNGRVIACSRAVLALNTPSNGSFYAVVDAIEEVSLSVPGSIRHD